jgi:ABC-2 type transport system ATP-binding protein
MTLSLGKIAMKSPIQLADLPFASDMADFESGGALEIDGDYDRVRFDGVSFDEASASGARFTESAFIGGSLDGGRLRKARFTDAWFEQTRLVAVDVAGAVFTDAWFNGSVFAGVQAFTCVLRRVVFRNCKLDSVNFREAALTDVTFEDCVLRDVDFGGAKLERLKFPGSTVSGLDFSKAKCGNVDLRGARLGERDDSGADGSGAGIKAGFESLSGVRIDTLQLMTLAPFLAHHLGITVKDLFARRAGLTLTLRQPRMLTGMSIPSAVNQAQRPAIRVQGLEKSYKELRVLRGVDFEVERGSIFALLGSNGAGKTTVVRILSTLLAADAGTASVNGFDVAAHPADVRESISLTGQFAAVDEILSGRENLILVARLRHLKNPGAIADSLLRRFSLTEAGARRAATYSGGMRRRLDIAMSLIGNPPVIFLDEPTSGLDPEARIEVWQAVRELAQGGTTVLLTTQYLDEAEQLADRIAILHQGRIIVNGTLAELRQLLPPAKVEYVEKQPSLEDVFFAVVGDRSEDATPSKK